MEGRGSPSRATGSATSASGSWPTTTAALARDLRPVLVVRLRPRAPGDRRRPRRRGREPGRVRRVLGAPGGVRSRRGSLRTWLGTLTHRRAVDYVRREEARRRRAERDAAAAVSAPDVEEHGDRDGRRGARACRARPAYRVTSGARSSSPTSGERPTVKLPRCSASRRERRSRGCASGFAESPRHSKHKEMSGDPAAELTDADVEELLGAYALDACEPEESRRDRSGARAPSRPRARGGDGCRARPRGSAPPRRSTRLRRLRGSVMGTARHPARG